MALFCFVLLFPLLGEPQEEPKSRLGGPKPQQNRGLSRAAPPAVLLRLSRRDRDLNFAESLSLGVSGDGPGRVWDPNSLGPEQLSRAP